MIGSLSGVLAELEPAAGPAVDAVVEVAGVGYRVVLGARHVAELGGIGATVRLSVHTHVREGAITLFGFPGTRERRAFELLITAHGVGPALAVAILGVHSPDGLARAVDAGDVDALMLVPGVGRKTAQRLVVELAERLDSLGSLGESGARRAPVGVGAIEVREALVALGYGTEEVRGALEALPGEGSVEELLREALRELAPRR